MTPIEEAFTDLAHAEKKDPAWVIQDLLPVGLTVIAGPPKISHKSTIALAMAALVLRWGGERGALPPWCKVPQGAGGPVMAFSYEADAGEVRSIMEDGLGLSVEAGGMYVATDPWKFQLDQGDGPAELVRYLEARDAAMAIFDPFRNMWGGDENDSGAVIKVLGPVQRWLKEGHRAGLMVHHVNKPPKEGSDGWLPGNMFSMRGSSAIPGLADGIIVIEPTKTEGVVRIHTKFKRGAGWTRTLHLGVPGYGWASFGYEAIPDMALALIDDWRAAKTRRDIHWLSELAIARKLQTRTIQEYMALLERNGLVPFNDDERRDLLPRTV